MFKRFLEIVSNKYVLSFIVFFCWVLFFDGNNLVERFNQLKRIDQLKKDKEYFKEKIISNKKQLEELKTDSKNLEKFAREQYLMKKDNEDIFLIVDP